MQEETKKDLKGLSDKICQEVAQDLLDSGVFEALKEDERKEEDRRSQAESK